MRSMSRLPPLLAHVLTTQPSFLLRQLPGPQECPLLSMRISRPSTRGCKAFLSSTRAVLLCIRLRLPIPPLRPPICASLALLQLQSPLSLRLMTSSLFQSLPHRVGARARLQVYSKQRITGGSQFHRMCRRRNQHTRQACVGLQPRLQRSSGGRFLIPCGPRISSCEACHCLLVPVLT